jgi:hypothetical protein
MDDFTPFLVGVGPASTVVDPDGTPNNILTFGVGGSVNVDWSFTGSAAPILAGLNFSVSLYADPVGLPPNVVIDSPQIVDGAAPLPSPPNLANAYQATFTIAPGSLAVGAYRLTALLTTTEKTTGASVPIAGFVDGPIIQVAP